MFSAESIMNDIGVCQSDKTEKHTLYGIEYKNLYSTEGIMSTISDWFRDLTLLIITGRTGDMLGAWYVNAQERLTDFYGRFKYGTYYIHDKKKKEKGWTGEFSDSIFGHTNQITVRANTEPETTHKGVSGHQLNNITNLTFDKIRQEAWKNLEKEFSEEEHKSIKVEQLVFPWNSKSVQVYLLNTKTDERKKRRSKISYSVTLIWLSVSSGNTPLRTLKKFKNRMKKLKKRETKWHTILL
jgi:hypothetical protein